ncbi:MAG TPA: hypothetical protein ENJ31_06885 [Anaerolineae bacterium]|nr:hypothetical protein [Anaerolineae bacterium]
MISIDDLGDRQETVYSAELVLLKKIAETASDFTRARFCSNFCEAIGGIKKTEKALFNAVASYERWLDEGDA